MPQFLKELKTALMRRRKDQGLAGLGRFNQYQTRKKKESVRRMSWNLSLCIYHHSDLREHQVLIMDISMVTST